jgi:Mrp family chromosome partitioning ATPase
MSRYFELMNRLGRDPDDFVGILRESQEAAAQSFAEPTVHRPRVEDNVFAQIESLVQQVFILQGKDAPAVVVFADVENEGTAPGICARVADVLAVHSRSVCAIDADFESPTLHEYFGMNNKAGVSDALCNSGSILNYCVRVDGSHLTVLPSGDNIRDLHGLLNSDALSSRVLELRKRFRHVLVQAPPVGTHTHSTVLGQLADGMILVLDDSTRRETARKVKENLDRAKVRVLGTILNNRTVHLPQSLKRML